MYRKLHSVIIYIIQNLKDKTLASPPYLKRIVYLVDWEYCQKHGKPLTESKWIKDEDGISIDHFYRIINDSLDVFKLHPLSNALFYVSLLDPSITHELTNEEKIVIDTIWKKVGNKPYDILAGNVFMTYPYKYYSSKKCQDIDLVKASKKLKSMV